MEVKFKNGDSVAIPEGCKAVVKDNVIIFETIEPKFKKGDFVYGNYSRLSQKFVFIFDREKDSNSSFNKANLFLDDERIFYSGIVEHDSIRPATESEKQQLIKKLRKNGKDWDAEKLEIIDYRWYPENNYDFGYYVTEHNQVNKAVNKSKGIIDVLYNVGNLFKTPELAEQAAEKVKELLLTLKHS